jgi:hypothetical protein
MYVLGKNGSLQSVKHAKSSPQVGTYAQVSSQNKRPWFSKPTSSKKRPGNTRKKRVVYPIFQECAALTNDPFWKKKFEQAGFGKFPRGFSYHEGLLMYKRGIKNEATKIPLSSPMEAYSVCIYFFRNAANIYSDQDKILLKEEEEKTKLQQQLKEKTWSNVSKKQKEVLIDLYVQELTERYHLTVLSSKKLQDLIYLGLFFKVLDKNVIHLEEGTIAHIDDLEYDFKTGEFVLHQDLKSKISKSSSKARKIPISFHPKHISYQGSSCMNFKTEWEKVLKTTVSTLTSEAKKSKHQSIPPKITHIKAPLNNTMTTQETETHYTCTEDTDCEEEEEVGVSSTMPSSENETFS